MEDTEAVEAANRDTASILPYTRVPTWFLGLEQQIIVTGIMANIPGSFRSTLLLPQSPNLNIACD